MEYSRISKFKSEEVILVDLKEFLKKVNGIYEEFVVESTYYTKPAQRIWLDLNGDKICLLVLIVQKCSASYSVFDICRDIISLHHGVIILCTGSMTETAIGACPIKIKESWGYFCTNNSTKLGRYLLELPTTPRQYYNFDDNQTFCLVVDKITDTQVLNKKMQQVLSCLDEEDDINEYVNNIKQSINYCLTQWLDSQCVTETNKRPSKKLKSIEFIDEEKYGDKVMMHNPKKSVEIRKFLNVNN